MPQRTILQRTGAQMTIVPTIRQLTIAAAVRDSAAGDKPRSFACRRLESCFPERFAI
jgi:hypothetical protein